MIYIDNANRTLTIPKTIRAEGSLVLQLVNSMTRLSKVFNVEDTNQNDYLYQIELTQSQVGSLPYGEYKFTLLAGTSVVGYGLMRNVKSFEADNVYSNVQPDTVYGDDTEVIYHTVSISAPLSGHLVVDGEMFQEYTESVPEGWNLAVQAVPGQGFHFSQWSDGETDNPRTLVVDGDIDLSAEFQEAEYHVTVTAGEHCSVAVNNVPGDFDDYVQGYTVLSVVATPDTGYNFVNWSDGNAASHRSLLVTSDISITTVTQMQTFMVNIMTSDNQQGLVVVNGTTGDYISQVGYGTVLNLSTQPLSGFEFIAWSDGNTSNQRTVTVTDNVTLRALFQEAAPGQPNDEIWYTSTDGQVVNPYSSSAFGGATIVSNSYSDGKGVIKFNQEVETVGGKAFWLITRLATVELPSSVDTLGDYAFYGCTSITSVTMQYGLIEIGIQTFAYCRNLTSVTIPESVTSIGQQVFRDCTCLNSITIPDAVAIIGQSSFDSCSALASVTIGSSVTSISQSAFYNCHSLDSITFSSTTSVPTIGAYAFEGVASTGTVYGQPGLSYTQVMNTLPVGWSLIQS